jgi:signal transduction histidine kinase
MSQATPPETSTSNRRQTVWLIGLSVWTVFVAVALWWLLGPGGSTLGKSGWLVQGGDPVQLTFAERARHWFQLVHLNFQRIYPWILFGPYVIWLASRFQLERGKFKLSAPIHLIACLAFVFATYAVNSSVSSKFTRVVTVFRSNGDFGSEGPNHGKATVRVEVSGSSSLISHEQLIVTHPESLALTDDVHQLAPASISGIPTNLIAELEHVMKPMAASTPGLLTMRPLATLMDLLAYVSLAGFAHAVHFYRRFRDRERRALALESSLARARLSALQAQLQPHFLFNTLNAIAALLRRDARAAEATLTSLSELLRLALSQSNRQEIPLREEMQFLDRYLEIQQTRFGERLRVLTEIQPETLECLVPTLLLQPLAENAIRHGIEPSATAGTVKVSAHRQDGRLELSVEDDGVGLTSESSSDQGNGIGLSNLRARLQELYGSDHSMVVASRSEGGVAVRIAIPCRTATSAEANGAPGKT